MNTRLAPLAACWLLLCSFALSAPSRPNVILILADDMGWNDAHFTGNPIIQTPHLDALAKSGMVFREACASAPNCAPTRACLLTGQYPTRHGVYTVVDERHTPGSPHHPILAAPSQEALPTTSLTLAEALKPSGYATALFGMWNLGRGRSGPTTPTGQGFDVFTEPKFLGFEKDAYHDASGRYSPDVLTDSAMDWITSVKQQPFFLYLAFHDVHAPYDPKPDLLKKYQDASATDPALAATVEAMDANIGRIVEHLQRLNLTDQTYIIFTSDNGGDRHSVAPLKGGKGTLYQGGVRVPALICGPSIPKGSYSSTLTLSMDWFPTILDLANINPPNPTSIDGKSLVPIFKNPSLSFNRDLFWHFPCYLGNTSPSSAIISGDWKLIENFETHQACLFNLKNDPSESIDLAASNPLQKEALLQKLHAWQAQSHAPCPSEPNPSYNPALKKSKGNRGNRNPS